MSYTIYRLASGSYDLLLDGALIGGVVRETSSDQATGWRAELLEDLPQAQRPKPFTQVEHHFETFGDVMSWLGGAANADGTECD